MSLPKGYGSGTILNCRWVLISPILMLRFENGYMDSRGQALVVQRVDSVIQWINLYPVVVLYLLDSD